MKLFPLRVKSAGSQPLGQEAPNNSAVIAYTNHRANNVYMVVSPLWCGPGNIHGFILDGKSYRQGKATAQTPIVPAVSGMKITTLLLRKCHLTTISCGRWSLVTNWDEEARRSSGVFNNNNQSTRAINYLGNTKI